MSTRSMIMLGLFVGSTVGGYIPTLFGFGIFSITSLIGSTLGSVIGVWVMYKFSDGLEN